MTYRERREMKADRLREWADKREAKASALHAANEPYRGDVAFNTQPGHIPERARAIARTERAFEHQAKAENFQRRASGIEAQLAGSIYSDDEDAIERLEERIAALEAERDRIKAYNASCRKAAKSGGVGDTSLLTEAEKADLVSLARYASFQLRDGGAFPAYKLSNLNGNLKRNRDRLATLKLQQTAQDRTRRLLNEQAERDAELIDCTRPGCSARFFLVTGRTHPTLCIDHADDASREANGWTPENSAS